MVPFLLERRSVSRAVNPEGSTPARLQPAPLLPGLRAGSALERAGRRRGGRPRRRSGRRGRSGRSGRWGRSRPEAAAHPQSSAALAEPLRAAPRLPAPRGTSVLSPLRQLFPSLCAFPWGWGALTRYASSLTLECPACNTARTWWRGSGALPRVAPLPCARQPADCLCSWPFLLLSRVGSLCPGIRWSLVASTRESHLLLKSCPAFALSQAPPSSSPPPPGACLASHRSSGSFATHPRPESDFCSCPANAHFSSPSLLLLSRLLFS